MANNNQDSSHQIARAAGVVMAAFILSNIIGLVRQILVSQIFGTEAVLDAFNAASTYPDLIFSIVAGGALASAFVPTLIGFLTNKDYPGAWRLASAISNLVFVTLAILSFVSMLAADVIVEHILAPGFGPAMQGLTASLLRIMLIAPTIFGISGLLMGILNAHQIFLWSALAPSMLWFGMILGIVLLAPIWGIFGLAWGYVLGAFLHLGIQVPALLRLPHRRYVRTLGLDFPAVRQVGRLMGPRLLGVAAVQINFVVTTILATGMMVGSLTSIKYAWAIMTMPQVVIAQAIAIAALPTFSRLVAIGDITGMRRSLAATLRGVILLSLPATIGMIFLREPLVAMLFQRGAFTVNSTELVSWALLWFSIGLIGHGVVEILSRAFYSLQDTKTPVFVGIGAMVLNVFLSLGFSALFTAIRWPPFGGLALANSLATSLEMAVLWALMRRRLGGIQGDMVLDGIIKSAVAASIMAVSLAGWVKITAGYPAWLVASGGVLIGAVIYFVGIYWLRVTEVLEVTQAIRNRL